MKKKKGIDIFFSTVSGMIMLFMSMANIILLCVFAISYYLADTSSENRFLFYIIISGLNIIFYAIFYCEMIRDGD